MRVVLLIAASCLLALPAASAGKAPPYRLAVTFDIDAVDEVAAIVDADSGSATRLPRDRTRGCSETSSVSWSPDGSRLAYATCAGIRVATADGGTSVLIRGDSRFGAPVGWSPDGRWIAVWVGADPDADSPDEDDESAAEPENDGITGIWVMRPDGSGRRYVAPGWPDAVWAGDSKHLVVDYDANMSCCGRAGLYVYDLRGRHRRLPNGADGHQPAISPDGRRVAFARGPEGDMGIVVERLDGTGYRVVTGSTDETFDAWPSWDPSSKRLAFVRGTKPPQFPASEAEPCDRSQDTDFFTSCPDEEPPDLDPVATRIWLAELASGRVRALSPERELEDASPLWSPDGRTIALARGAPGPDVSVTKLVLVDVATGRDRVIARRLLAIDGWRPT